MEEHPDNFKTVQTTVDYEIQNGLLKQNTPSGLPAATRTLLRLHRALEFFVKFISRLNDEPSMDGKTSVIASEVYGETLANYHPWLVRQAAYLVLRTLPNKRTFVENYCKHGVEEVAEHAGKAVDLMQEIFDVIQSLFAQHDLLELS